MRWRRLEGDIDHHWSLVTLVRLEGDIDHWSSLTLVTLVTLVTGQWMHWWDWKVTLAQRGSTTDGPMIFYERDVWQCAKYNLMRKVQFNAQSTIHRWKYMYNCTMYMYTTLNGHIWLLHPFTSIPWVGRTFTGLMQASDEKYLRWIALIRNEKDLEKLEIVYFCHVM